MHVTTDLVTHCREQETAMVIQARRASFNHDPDRQRKALAVANLFRTIRQLVTKTETTP
jgi:hypothetical protein